MLILSIETSGRNGGVALARGDAESFDLLGEAPIGAGQYSAELMPRIVELLRAAGIAKVELEAFAVAWGPGSFTGLRVGIATAKALAATLAKPLAAVSVLEAIVASAFRKLAACDPQARERELQRQNMAALMDAGRGEVYAGFYWVASARRREAEREVLLPFEGVIQELSSLAPPVTVVTPDSSVAERLRERNISVMLVERPAARDVARLGLQKLAAGEAAGVAELDANYIRRSDAEIFSLPRLQAK
ncbi:MAG TPA: tRNA (adenosine(37)-N6)-threonylcarbamoyltransferase complex dimerization subunit type 1 TsaB [Terriglobales bacterium]|nr:tRNA (adenosine(37)-N6)-threonylcarbamoyltransferase complex dimerization subunit type 1 TsaB [Terriglobales bacterium]